MASGLSPTPGYHSPRANRVAVSLISGEEMMRCGHTEEGPGWRCSTIIASQQPKIGRHNVK